jgi:hypothetical protein
VPPRRQKPKEVLMTKKHWDDFSGSQKTGIVVLAAAQIGLLAAALWDLAHRDAEEVRGDRRVWTGLVFVNWIGPLAYFALGRKGSGCRWVDCCCGSGADDPETDTC